MGIVGRTSVPDVVRAIDPLTDTDYDPAAADQALERALDQAEPESPGAQAGSGGANRAAEHERTARSAVPADQPDRT
jgi:hypothetical protein